jgi:single-stranded DNA-specific DHH superfamily exonuclease
VKKKEEFELDEYERWIESEIEKGNFVPVENFEEWKRALEEAARRTLERLDRKKKRLRFTVEAPSPEVKEEAIKLLKERFGEAVKVEE